MRFDLRVSAEEMSGEELIVVVRGQAGQITAQAGQLAELMESNEASESEFGERGGEQVSGLASDRRRQSCRKAA